jgi:hypothetical protein
MVLVPYSNAVAISFGTSCYRRLHQLQQTFDANVEAIAKDSDVEWIILNYNGTDDLHDFMMSRLPELPRHIIYVRDTGNRPWHLSVAKNRSHRLGSGRMLMNIDCDNFIGDAAGVIRPQLLQGHRLIHLWSETFYDGTFGRVAVEKDLFYSLGGYDESLYPMGYQDVDFLRRAAASGVRARLCPCAKGMAITNTKEESIRYCSTDGLFWSDYNRMNQEKSAANIAAKKLTANVESPWAELKPEIYTGQAR